MCAIWRKRSSKFAVGCGGTASLVRSALPHSCAPRNKFETVELAHDSLGPTVRRDRGLRDIETRRRPAADVLKDWGLSHRFAGSSDRAAIAGLVYDTLRRKSSSAWLMGEASARAAAIGMLHRERGLAVDEIADLCSGARFAPAPLTEAERAALAGDRLANAPTHIRGDYPEWLDPHFSRAFGDDRAAEGAALASRAPLDLRVNTLKAEREEVLPKLDHLHAEPTR